MADWPKLGAIAAVIRGEAMLLVRRRNPPDAGLWGLPGGHVEPGETALDAAAREVAEETGVTVHPRGYLTNIDVIRHGPDGALAIHFLLAVVDCAHVAGTPRPADDVSDAAWVPFETIARGGLPMSDRVGEVLELALGACHGTQ